MTANDRRQALAAADGRDTYRLDVVESWPACVRCGSPIRWPAQTARPGQWRRCSCPGVLWRCAPTGWECIEPQPAGVPSSTEGETLRPSYEAIAAAIRNACDVAAVELEIRHDGSGNPVPDPHLKLARMLEQGGLIDAEGVGDQP